MHITKPQPTKEIKAEKPKGQSPEKLISHSNNSKRSKKPRKEKKND